MNEKHRWIALAVFAVIVVIGATVAFWPGAKPAPAPHAVMPSIPAPAQPPSAGFDSATLLTATPPSVAAPLDHEPLPLHTQHHKPPIANEGPPISFMPERLELSESGEWQNGWDEPVAGRNDGILARLPDWSAAAEWLVPSKPITDVTATQPTPQPEFPMEATPSEQEPAAKVATHATHERYIVKPNDTLWTISQRTYGTGAFFVALGEHNRSEIGHSRALEIGQSLVTPPATWLLKKYPQLCPPPSKAIAGSTLFPPAEAHQPEYVVRESDTLDAISVISLGRSDRWREILALNQDVLGSSGGYLKPGMVLNLPPDARAATTVLRPADTPR